MGTFGPRSLSSGFPVPNAELWGLYHLTSETGTTSFMLPETVHIGRWLNVT